MAKRQMEIITTLVVSVLGSLLLAILFALRVNNYDISIFVWITAQIMVVVGTIIGAAIAFPTLLWNAHLGILAITAPIWLLASSAAIVLPPERFTRASLFSVIALAVIVPLLSAALTITLKRYWAP